MSKEDTLVLVLWHIILLLRDSKSPIGASKGLGLRGGECTSDTDEGQAKKDGLAELHDLIDLTGMNRGTVD